MDKLFNLQSYYYDLPECLIAQYPLTNRDECKLLVVDRKTSTIKHDLFKNLSLYIPQQTDFVVNNSKVISARLLGQKPDTGGQVEIFILKQLEDASCFEVLLKPLKKIKENQLLKFEYGLEARLINKDNRVVQFNRKDVLEYLEKVGHIPLPPYIKREDKLSDKQDYQTVYAKQLGSVAAPTAGLHFTHELITSLKKQKRRFFDTTLHIGYGTFKPVETADIRDHQIHQEYYEITLSNWESIKRAKLDGKHICVVGTTACRLVETVAINNKFEGETNLFVYPGFCFKMTDHLITNFHLPYSSLLMLVCAFGGHALIMNAYKEAISKEYRFYSYGDAMLIL